MEGAGLVTMKDHRCFSLAGNSKKSPNLSRELCLSQMFHIIFIMFLHSSIRCLATATARSDTKLAPRKNHRLPPGLCESHPPHIHFSQDFGFIPVCTIENWFKCYHQVTHCLGGSAKVTMKAHRFSPHLESLGNPHLSSLSLSLLWNSSIAAVPQVEKGERARVRQVRMKAHHNSPKLAGNS